MKNKFRLSVFAVIAGLILLLSVHSLPSARAAGPWYVSNSGSDSNDCASTTTTCASINGALNKPGFVAGDTVKVAIGTYLMNYTGSRTEVVYINKNATISGGWDSAFAGQTGMSTIDGDGSWQGMTVGAVTAVVERFIVQNGSGVGYAGPGIRNLGTLTLNNSNIRGNSTTSIGGGIYNPNPTTLTLNNSTVSGNSAISFGGGIYAYESTVVLNNSTVSGNKVNSGWNGGGIWISGNNYSLVLNNSTVSDNTGGSGGGIYSGGGLNSLVTLRNTLLAGNMATSGSDCSGSISSAGYNLIGNTSGCTFTSATGDLTNVHPMLGALQNNGGSTPTHALRFGSPAINAGNPAGCTDQAGNPLNTDQRSAPRVGRCDIGAYEYGSAPPLAGPYFVYLPLIQKSGCTTGICGRVTFNGGAASGVSLSLRFYNGSSWSTFATSTTDPNGNYSFTGVASLAAGQLYYVLFTNSVDNTRLSLWKTRQLTSYTAGSNVAIEYFDVANIALVSPFSGATVGLPYTFQWTARPATPSDSYEFNLYQSGGTPYWWTDPILGYVSNYTLRFLPPSFSPSVQYRWYVAVYSPDGGYGESYYDNLVMFSNTGASPVNKIPVAPKNVPEGSGKLPRSIEKRSP